MLLVETKGTRAQVLLITETKAIKGSRCCRSGIRGSGVKELRCYGNGAKGIEGSRAGGSGGSADSRSGASRRWVLGGSGAQGAAGAQGNQGAAGAQGNQGATGSETKAIKGLEVLGALELKVAGAQRVGVLGEVCWSPRSSGCSRRSGLWNNNQ